MKVARAIPARDPVRHNLAKHNGLAIRPVSV
jgi:hypothetical protein